MKAQSQAYLTTMAFKEWKTGRVDKVSRAGTGVQRFLCTVGDFLHSFSGMAEIIKSADQQFGGLAYGTVVLLAAVAVQKQRREDTIEEFLEELSYAFPRLNTLQQLRGMQNLRNLIITVFELVIRFCRETIDYFAGSSISRVKKALKPKELKMETISQLRRKLIEVHKECEVVMLDQLAGAREDILKLQIQLQHIDLVGKETKVIVEDGQLWMRQETDTKARERYLSNIRPWLLPRPFEHVPIADSVAKVHGVLRHELSDLDSGGKSGQKMTASLMKRKRPFSEWLHRSDSSVMLLSGCNWADVSAIQVTWLSHVSVLLTKKAEEGRMTLAFFCQTAARIKSPRSRRSFRNVMRSLIYQLAELTYPELQPEMDLVRDILASDDAASAEDETVFEALRQAMVQALAKYDGTRELTIVIDRLDQSSPPDEWETLYCAVDTLLQLVHDISLKHLKMKVLLVMDEGPARRVAKHFDPWKGRGLETLDWDQEAEEEDEEE